MKRHIFSILCIIITSFCAFSQDDINIFDNSRETFMLTSGLSSEYEVCSLDKSLAESTFINSQSVANSMKSFDYRKTLEWKKYKILRISGWTALGIGIPVTFTGIIGICLNINDGGKGGPGYQ